MKLRNLYVRLRNAAVLFYLGLTQPLAADANNFKMLCELLGLILRVAQEQRPYMSKIGIGSVKVGVHTEVCSIWVGPGASSDPYTRIDELNKENARLKAELDALLK